MSTHLSPAIRYAGFAATLVVAAVVLYESTQTRGSPGVPDLTTNEAYLAHLAVYAAMTFCALTAIGRRSFYAVVIVAELAIGLGIAMEIFQAYVPGRTPSLGDVIANASGAVFGAATFGLFLRVLDTLTPQPTKL